MRQSPSVELLYANYARLVNKPRALLTADEHRSLGFYQAELADDSTAANECPVTKRLTTWAQAVRLLEAFCESEGRMPRENRRLAAGMISEEEKKLAQHVRAFRRAHDAGRLCSYQVQRLECVPGFSWHPLEARWNAAFLEYRSFIERNMDVPKLRSRKPAERRLAAWAAKNRLAYRDGTLTVKRAHRLRGLTFWTWGEPIPRRRQPTQGVDPERP
jgi:hypothetical protein